MNESTALVKRQLTPDVWSMIWSIAPVIHESRLFGTYSKEQAAAIMLTAYELGLPLTTGFQVIHIIQGKPSLSPRGALALIQQSGQLEAMKITESADACTVWMRRKSGIEYTATFTMDDARRAGLIKPDSGWTKYPANMLRARAIGFCADVVFPDVLGGLKRADEFDADVDDAGNVVETSWTTVTPATTDKAPTLDELLATYSAEEIVAANGGRIPATDDQLAHVAATLGGGRG